MIDAELSLVPTRVGMILIMPKSHSNLATCPHTRGDDPLIARHGVGRDSLSPHAWG